MTAPAPATRVVRIIARLNIGGPAIQAITLTRELGAHAYPTRLVRGSESEQEGNMDHLARELGVVPTLIASMRRDPGPGDLVALVHLIRIIRRDRPALVHTHAAKGGTLGRLAALLAFPRRRRRPALVHTYHGHSLTGYFSSRTAGFYRLVERMLARRTDALIAVSDEVQRDLVGMSIAPPAKFHVIPLGFELSPFLDDADRDASRAAIRADWGIGPDEHVLALIARLVPIKRVDRFLAVARLLADRVSVRFVIVGDGELRAELEASADAMALAGRLVWAGFRRDMAGVCFASDLVALTSDNEGTPVSLIEAQAAAVPVIATDVGGVRSAVRDGVSGLLFAPDDLTGFAAGVGELLDDPGRRLAMGAAGRAHAATAYSLGRLVEDHVRLYDGLLLGRGGPAGRRAQLRPPLT